MLFAFSSLDRKPLLSGISAAVQHIKQLLTWAEEGKEQKEITSHHTWSKTTKAGYYCCFQVGRIAKGHARAEAQANVDTRGQFKYPGRWGFVSYGLSRAWKRIYQPAKTKP